MYTRRKTRVGVVTSDKMQKTVVVAVESHKRHPLYNKTIRRTTRYKVHDEKELAKLGDIVRITESRPLSREKRWKLAEVVTRHEVAEIAPREIDASMFGIRRLHTQSAAAAAEAAPVEEPTASVAPVAEAEPGEDFSPPVTAEQEEAPPAEAETEVAQPEAPVAEEAPPAEAESEPKNVGEDFSPPVTDTKEEQTEE
jgi:small subunit ribosomal protein S17